MTSKERAAMQRLIDLTAEICEYSYSEEIEQAYADAREALAEQDGGSVCARCGGIVYDPVIEQAEQEPFDMDDHPPHRLCECRKCMEYFTPLPDCDAFAASGKPIAEQTNTQFMEGYRIGLAEMREKCAKVCDDMGNTEANMNKTWRNGCSDAAAAIRAINFEGDTGFRPVSEMIADHKQDPKKAAAIEKAKMRKASRAEKIAMPSVYEVPVEQAEQKQAELKECRHCGFLCAPNPDESRKWYPLEQPVSQEPKSDCPCCGAKSSVLPMAFCRECKSEFWPPQPVRTKDLTDDEIKKVWNKKREIFSFARAVIAADRRKNK